MIEIRNIYPKNKAHFLELLEFCSDVLPLCRSLNVAPVLSGSLAVFAYTQDQTIEVRDIDLACSERAFPTLSAALSARGFECRLKAWHVLQVHQGHLKIEFDAAEYWLKDLPETYDTLTLEGTVFHVISLAGLTELYRRGLEATATENGEASRAKHTAILEKYRALRRMAKRQI